MEKRKKTYRKYSMGCTVILANGKSPKYLFRTMMKKRTKKRINKKLFTTDADLGAFCWQYLKRYLLGVGQPVPSMFCDIHFLNMLKQFQTLCQLLPTQFILFGWASIFCRNEMVVAPIGHQITATTWSPVWQLIFAEDIQPIIISFSYSSLNQTKRHAQIWSLN